jgi:RNA polymerase-binding protein DksA
MVETFSSEAREAHLTADHSDRLDSESPVGTASDESLALAAHAHELVAEIDLALARLASGNYGYCQPCGNAIPCRRLRAVPATTMCIECANRALPPVVSGTGRSA